ncbi:AraC family transcriptional regulator [Streptomyces sp. CT34]|uniref:helix-turn-helix domain-containing protein n=1 Tax=Streptomyces sp. CT34 TaxID=1553907 RepID=UPI00068E98ED|nr:AraC family transcriptional regulator [Streptomyces sp. CT34]
MSPSGDLGGERPMAARPLAGHALPTPPSPGARLRQVRHESELGCWETVWRRPLPSLRRFVAGYLGYDESGRSFRLRRELPSDLITLVVGFELSVRVLRGQQADEGGGPEGGLRQQIFVIGAQDRYRCTETAPVSSGILVRFTPVGARVLLGLPMHLMANQAVGGAELLDALLLERLAQLAGKAGWEERFATLDTLLAQRLTACADGLTPSPTERAWRQIRRSAGQVAVRDLAAATGYSHKHLIDRFRDEIGLAPKTLSQVMRFRSAVRLIDTGTRLTDIAHSCGYTDQCHLSREFARYAGRSPSAFSRSWLPDGGGLRAD